MAHGAWRMAASVLCWADGREGVLIRLAGGGVARRIVWVWISGLCGLTRRRGTRDGGGRRSRREDVNDCLHVSKKPPSEEASLGVEVDGQQSNLVESNENLELDESIKQGEQITDVDTDTFSITCSSSSITPLKRSISNNDRGEDLSVDNVPAQHSYSKMKKIKIEKEDV
ncbi:hypothetical protein Taro_032981 [Colocasia esculenta]|uniref:Uncharacterized protein n=1 Tax=Colocasia esculenta TaxID=4460 RepID=A0A843VU18_COLES|nr:hypothetical protein [Colocasia esculenta]